MENTHTHDKSSLDLHFVIELLIGDRVLLDGIIMEVLAVAKVR